MSPQPATESSDRIRMFVLFGAIGLMMIAGFGVLAWTANSTQSGGAQTTQGAPGQDGAVGNAAPGAGTAGSTTAGGAATGPNGAAAKTHNYTDWVGNAPLPPRPGSGGLQGPDGPPGHIAGD